MPRQAFELKCAWYARLTGSPVLLGYGVGSAYYVPLVDQAVLKSDFRARCIPFVTTARRLAAAIDADGVLQMPMETLQAACAEALAVYHRGVDLNGCLRHGLLTAAGCARIVSAMFGKEVRCGQ